MQQSLPLVRATRMQQTWKKKPLCTKKKKKEKSFCLEESAANFDYHHLKASYFPHHFFVNVLLLNS